MDIIAATDHATSCHTCGRPLRDSPSDLFCGQGCQATWHAHRVGVEPEFKFGPCATFPSATPPVPPPATNPRRHR